MKGIFFILILLAVSTLRRKEACKTSTPNIRPAIPNLHIQNLPISPALSASRGGSRSRGKPRTGSAASDEINLVPRKSTSKAPGLEDISDDPGFLESPGSAEEAASYGIIHGGNPGEYTKLASPTDTVSTGLAKSPKDDQSAMDIVPETPSIVTEGNDRENSKSSSGAFHFETSDSNVETEDADTDAAENPPPPVHETCDFLAIGGGPQGVAMAAQLAMSRELNKVIKIFFVEEKSEFGVGVPFDGKVVTDEHLLNVYIPKDISINGGPVDFSSWASGKDLAGYNFQNPPPRKIVGQYLSERFHGYIAKFNRGKKYTIVLMNGTIAVDIAPNEQRDASIVKLNNGVTVEARYVLLATGHFFPSRFPGTVNGYHESPWPSDRLKRIPAAHIGALGSSLSSTDTIVTTSHNFGEFTTVDKMKGTLKYRSDHDNFKITVYSRSGHLPRINRRYYITYDDPKYLIEEKLKSLGEDPFEQLFTLLKQEILYLLPFFEENDPKILGMGMKQFFDHLDKKTNEKWGEPQKRFIDDVKDENIRKETREVQIKLESIFISLQSHYKKHLKQFSAEQFILFNNQIAPRIVKSATRIPMVNAQKLHALINDNGRLSIKAIGDKSRITPKDDGRGVLLEYGDNYEHRVEHDYFIDALGQSGHIRRDKRNLTRSLLEHGLAKPVLYRYRDQKYAQAVKEGDKAEDEAYNNERKRIVKDEVTGQFYYEGDGVQMHGNTPRVVTRKDFKGVIFAGPPFTYSYAPFAKNLARAVDFAKEVMTILRNADNV